jgi:hypothetical protein
MMANHKEFERYDMKVERSDLAYSIYLPTSPRGAIMKQYIIPPTGMEFLSQRTLDLLRR